jgi:hypothetical protein
MADTRKCLSPPRYRYCLWTDIIPASTWSISIFFRRSFRDRPLQCISLTRCDPFIRSNPFSSPFSLPYTPCRILGQRLCFTSHAISWLQLQPRLFSVSAFRPHPSYYKTVNTHASRITKNTSNTRNEVHNRDRAFAFPNTPSPRSGVGTSRHVLSSGAETRA